MKSIILVKTILSGMLVLSMATSANAQNVTVPNTFSPGTAAHADEVNANFQALEDAMNNKSDMLASIGYSITPAVRNVTISNVKINGGAITAPVAAGSTINVSLDYKITDASCPGCIDEIQVGFSHDKPASCVYQGIPGSAGASGSATFTITAPTTTGTYYLGSDRAQDYSCPVGWWNSAPTTSNRWFAVISVQ